MQAGRLDQRITIKRENRTGYDSFGQPVLGTPVDVASVWAEVIYLAGRELEAVQQTWAEARYKIRLRRQMEIEINRAYWIDWQGDTLDILDVQGPRTRNPEWVIIAKDHVE
jgi:head-tail adaptor